jgi:nitrogen-specific signal transduction histidine kinase
MEHHVVPLAAQKERGTGLGLTIPSFLLVRTDWVIE